MAEYKVKAKEAEDLWDDKDHADEDFDRTEKDQATKALEAAETTGEDFSEVHARKGLLEKIEPMLEGKKDPRLFAVIQAGKNLNGFMDSHFRFVRNDKDTVSAFLDGVQTAYDTVIDACEDYRGEREPWTVDGKRTRSMVGAFEAQAKAQKDFFDRSASAERTEDYFAGLGRDTLRAGVSHDELVDGAFAHEEHLAGSVHWEKRHKREAEEYVTDRLHSGGEDPNRKRNIDAMWKTTGRLAMEDVFLDSSFFSNGAARTYLDLKKAQIQRGMTFMKTEKARKDETKVRLIHFLLSGRPIMEPDEFLYDWKGGSQRKERPMITHITARNIPALSESMETDSARIFLNHFHHAQLLQDLLKRDLLGLLEATPMAFSGYEAVVARLRAIYGIIGSTR